MQVLGGRFISNNDIENNALVCLIDESIAKQYYKRTSVYGKKIILSVGDKSSVFTIVGTVKKNSNILNSVTGQILPEFIYIPYTTMQNFSLKSAFDQIIYTSTNDMFTTDIFKSDLHELSSRYNNLQVNANDLSQQKDQINNIVNAAFIALYIVSCISLVVCSVSVASSVNTAVISKQKDIGIKLSMGASRFDITSEFMMLSISACLTGILISLLTMMIFIIILQFLDIQMYFSSSLIVISISATIMLTALFSFIPSYKASKMLPIKALNRE